MTIHLALAMIALIGGAFGAIRSIHNLRKSGKR
jgi:hypothetical protein